MKTASDLIWESENERRATAAVAAALCRDSHLSAEPLATFKRRGFDEYSHLFTKAAVDALDTSNEGLAERGPLEQAFAGAVDRASLLDALISGGAVVMPLGPAAAARILLGSVTAQTVAEGAIKPVMEIDFDLSAAPQKVEGQIVTSAEAARSFDFAVQSGIRAHLVSACAAAVNVQLVAAFTAGASTGSATPGALLAALSSGAPKRPAIVGGFSELLALDAGTVRDLSALGVAVLPCSEASGYLIGLDLSGLLIADAGAVVETAKHSTIHMHDGASPEGTVVVSLWQKNLQAIRGERWFSISLRPDAVAFASVGSPA